MQTLDLIEAAEYLKMNAEVLRRKTKNGEIPGRKAGKCYVFVKEHLADWISGRYPEHGRELRVIDGGKQQTEGNLCQSINAVKVKHGGSTSPQQTETEYDNLLGLKTNKRRKNCTTE